MKRKRGDLPFSEIYSHCGDYDVPKKQIWTDITDDVAQVIEHEVGGKFVGDGWRDFKKRKELAA